MHRLSPLSRFAPYALKHKATIIAALIALVCAAVATLIMPLAVRRMIDTGFSGQEGGMIDGYFTALIAVAALLAVASAARYYLVITLGERVVADVRAAVFDHLMHLDAAFFDRMQSGEILSRLTADTGLIRSAFGATASIALRNGVLLVGSLVMMAVTSPWLAVLVIAIIPLIVLPLIMTGRRVRNRSRAAQDTLAAAAAFAGEAIGAVRVMQSFNAQNATALRFRDSAQTAFRAAQAAARSRAILSGIGIFLVSACVVGVLWHGARLVIDGQMTGGRLSQFVLYALFASGALGQLSEVYAEISQAAGAAERLNDILAVEAVVKNPEKPLASHLPPQGEIAFENVSFAYTSYPDRLVLKDLSFRIAPGETVALVGTSGGGKSSILHLIARFYDLQAGRILIDGVAVNALDLEALRAMMALVPQDPVVFGATILENIRYGRQTASDAEVKDAAQQASAHSFIVGMPQGYETHVGERGVTLSGGQRQRIAIARAVLKDAPILLLDEATSALDAESERDVQSAMAGLARTRTTVVVAHRLATVLSANRIFVIDDGRIVEEGSHTALLKQDGLYARLVRLQFDLPE